MKKYIVDPSNAKSTFEIRDIVYGELVPIIKENRQIIILCIGTDRSTGDSLGPLVGHKLKCLIRKNVKVLGDLEYPVHAKNLCDVINKIYSEYCNPYIIAIDACLGAVQNVGKIFIEDKSLTPGAAMNKDLPAIGNLSITGIVNISGALEFMVLQNTRLHTVMQLADTIANGIYHSIIKALGGKKELPLDEKILSEKFNA